MAPVSNDSASDTQASTVLHTQKGECEQIDRVLKSRNPCSSWCLSPSHPHFCPSLRVLRYRNQEFLNNCLLILSYCRTFGTCYPSQEEMDMHTYMRRASTPTVICPLIPSNASVIHSLAAVFCCVHSTDQDGAGL